MINATLRLFNAIQVETKRKQKIPKEIVTRTVKNGYVLDPRIAPEPKVLSAIEKIIGISGEKANASFHKSWSVVKDSPIETLVVQQIVHYLTTYGFEALGIYDKKTVYIPKENLDLPEIKDSIPLTVVKAMNKKEILNAVISLGSGVALSKETLEDLIDIIKTNKYDKSIVGSIKNHELKAMLNEHFGIVPKDPVEFLRYVVNKLTGESLLIKNNNLIKKIKEAKSKDLDKLIKDAPKNLASIFFRFKPLFLAMKTISKNKQFFNQLRKKADKLHRPLPEDYLNSITAHIKNDKVDYKKLAEKLKKVNVFRKIRLAYALNYRLKSNASIVYRVRNGRGWATDFAWDKTLNNKTKRVLSVVLDAITKDIKKNVKGKTIYIPRNVNYALPATEKQFIGQLPTGTWVSVPKDLIVGIHWQNLKGYRVDLDLSLVGALIKFGWDRHYRLEARDILFSGDVTDAPGPKGASELFYIRKEITEPMLLTVNFYNFIENTSVDCKVLAASESPNNFDRNYMVDISNIVCSALVEINKPQTVLGLVMGVDGENRVYFTNMGVGLGRTSSNNRCANHTQTYMVNATLRTIDFKELLINAKANVVDERPKEEDYIDLSPENVNKETIIGLLQSI